VVEWTAKSTLGHVDYKVDPNSIDTPKNLVGSESKGSFHFQDCHIKMVEIHFYFERLLTVASVVKMELVASPRF